ncbi:hypothetical protein ASD40_18460 [Paenibacillus sp. Root444D2]|nr:hypothetical protein ASD40_18460 [Paenibacillus sp. Root444D2]KRE50782.1 hypothetical protein ASG85_19670 [Paenibacillus sp. Soil724D2]
MPILFFICIFLAKDSFIMKVTYLILKIKVIYSIAFGHLFKRFQRSVFLYPFLVISIPILKRC